MISSIRSIFSKNNSEGPIQSSLQKLPEELQQQILLYFSKEELWGSKKGVALVSKDFYKMTSDQKFILYRQNEYLTSFFQTIRRIDPNYQPNHNETISEEELEEALQKSLAYRSKTEKIFRTVDLLSPGIFDYFLIRNTLKARQTDHGDHLSEELQMFNRKVEQHLSALCNVDPLSILALDKAFFETFSLTIDKSQKKILKIKIISIYNHLFKINLSRFFNGIIKISTTIKKEFLPLLTEGDKTNLSKNFLWNLTHPLSLTTSNLTKEKAITLQEWIKQIPNSEDAALAIRVFFNEKTDAFVRLLGTYSHLAHLQADIEMTDIFQSGSILSTLLPIYTFNYSLFQKITSPFSKKTKEILNVVMPLVSIFHLLWSPILIFHELHDDGADWLTTSFLATRRAILNPSEIAYPDNIGYFLITAFFLTYSVVFLPLFLIFNHQAFIVFFLIGAFLRYFFLYKDSLAIQKESSYIENVLLKEVY